MASEGADDAVAKISGAGNDSWGEGDGFGTAEDSTEQYSHEQTQEPTTSLDPAHSAPGDVHEDDADSGEYDPESVTMTTATVTLPPAVAAESFESADSSAPPAAAAVPSSRPVKKPKKAGGFIVGSSDDEDDTPVPAPAPSTLQAQAVDEQPIVLASLPLQQPAAAQEVAAPAQVSNGGLDNSHLPADAIGMLEDRVNNDPRGDMDAWLALIAETRRRNVIQDTRAVYERFLQVFPQSVSRCNSDHTWYRAIG
jgi:cleavage stimulation factor subunit 3